MYTSKYFFLWWGFFCWLCLSLLVSDLVNPKSSEFLKAFWNGGVWLGMIPVATVATYLRHRFRFRVQHLLQDKMAGYILTSCSYLFMAFYLWDSRAGHSVVARFLFFFCVWASYNAGFRAVKVFRERLRHEDYETLS